MGDPRKTRRKFSTPRILWNEALLSDDKELLKEYKLKNKREIWRMKSFLENVKSQAKSITSALGTARKEQALKQQDQLFTKVKRLGLIRTEEINLSDLLNLSIRDVMNRRLQTLVFKRKLAHTTSQARQFIVHGHIKLGGKKITAPSYLVPLDEEESIDFVTKSRLASLEHPERGDVDPAIILKNKKDAEDAKKAAEAAEAKASEPASNEAENNTEESASKA